MATVNLFGDLALEATQTNVKTAVETVAGAVVTQGAVTSGEGGFLALASVADVTAP